MTISLPLYIFLFAYFGFLLIFTVFVAINFYHIVSSGTLTSANFFVTIFSAVTTIFILFGTYQLLQGTDWQMAVTLFDLNWFSLVIPEPYN